MTAVWTRRAALGGACGAAVLRARARAIEAPEAIAGDRFVTAETECLIDDIVAPRGSAPFAREATAALQALLASGEGAFEETRRDRWRRPVGRLISMETGAPMERRLVAGGAARVHPRSAFHDSIRALLDAELAARRARAGLWRLSAYRPLNANEAEDWSWGRMNKLIGGFHIAVGTLSGAAKRGRRIYFNFGADYRSDFTATFEGRAEDIDLISGVDLAASTLAGRSVEVRGFVEAINGPSIALRHPLQILARPAA